MFSQRAEFCISGWECGAETRRFGPLCGLWSTTRWHPAAAAHSPSHIPCRSQRRETPDLAASSTPVVAESSAFRATDQPKPSASAASGRSPALSAGACVFMSVLTEREGQTWHPSSMTWRWHEPWCQPVDVPADDPHSHSDLPGGPQYFRSKHRLRHLGRHVRKHSNGQAPTTVLHRMSEGCAILSRWPGTPESQESPLAELSERQPPPHLPHRPQQPQQTGSAMVTTAERWADVLTRPKRCVCGTRCVWRPGHDPWRHAAYRCSYCWTNRNRRIAREHPGPTPQAAREFARVLDLSWCPECGRTVPWDSHRDRDGTCDTARQAETARRQAAGEHRCDECGIWFVPQKAHDTLCRTCNVAAVAKTQHVPTYEASRTPHQSPGRSQRKYGRAADGPGWKRCARCAKLIPTAQPSKWCYDCRRYLGQP